MYHLTPLHLRTLAQVDPDIPTDKVQVAVKLTAERSVGGVLEKGDTVGVYLSFDPFNVDEAGQAAADDPAATATTRAFYGAADVVGTPLAPLSPTRLGGACRQARADR